MNDTPWFLNIQTRLLPLFVHLIWVLAYGWLLVHGDYRTFLRPTLWPVVLLGLLASLVFVGGVILTLGKMSQDTGRAERWLGSFLLLIPLLFILISGNQSLGSYALEKRAVDLERGSNPGLQPTPTPATLPANYGEVVMLDGPDFSKEPNEITLIEITKFSRQISGHRIITQGMVHRGKRTPEGHFVLFQFLITCCIADSQAVSVLVASDQADSLRKDQWVRVEGVLETSREPGIQRIWVSADRVTPLAAPSAGDQYLVNY